MYRIYRLKSCNTTNIVLIALAIFPNFSITKIEMPCRANSVMGL